MADQWSMTHGSLLKAQGSWPRKMRENLDWDPEDPDCFSDSVRQAPPHSVSDVVSMILWQLLSFGAKVFFFPIMLVHLEIISSQLCLHGDGGGGWDYVLTLITHYILESKIKKLHYSIPMIEGPLLIARFSWLKAHGGQTYPRKAWNWLGDACGWLTWGYLALAGILQSCLSTLSKFSFSLACSAFLSSASCFLIAFAAFSFFFASFSFISCCRNLSLSEFIWARDFVRISSQSFNAWGSTPRSDRSNSFWRCLNYVSSHGNLL